MKKYTYPLVLGIILCICVLAGCGSSVSNSGPDQTQLERDLADSLDEYKDFLTLNSCEITQSLTEDHNFSATTEVVAESEYAEFQLQAEVKYTKYDQGWEMDSCTWSEKIIKSQPTQLLNPLRCGLKKTRT